MNKETNTCLQKKIGSCQGCNILNIIAEQARWQRISPQQAANEVSVEYCPGDAKPQVQHIGNPHGSFAMGQPRPESFDFTGTKRNKKGKKLHGNY